MAHKGNPKGKDKRDSSMRKIGGRKGSTRGSRR